MKMRRLATALAISASGVPDARAYNPPRESAEQAQQREDFYRQALDKAKSGGPDEVIAERAADPLGGSLPSIPKPSRGAAARELWEMIGEKLGDALGEQIKERLLKNTPKPSMVRQSMEKIDSLLQKMDPRSGRLAESKLELARAQMAADYAEPRMQYCQGIPPITCNRLNGGRFECAGGPQRYQSNGIPPWEYTLVAKCNGARFAGFESFVARGATATVIPTEDDGHGGRTYRGNAHASYCVPCPNQPANDTGKLLRCLFVGCR